MRACLVIACLSMLGCVRARERRAAEHLRNELSFLVPFVDLDAEERAVRNVLAQRRLGVDERVKGNGFVALSASTFDQKRTAVRIITGRGVVAAEDGDVDDLFGPRHVTLASVSTGGPGSEMLLGIAKTERAHDQACAQFFRVRPDGNLAGVEIDISRFGTRACLNALARDAGGKLVASVGWPSLSAGTAPTLSVDMRIESGRLDQPEPDSIRLRVEADDTAYVARESARIEAALPRASAFPERQALGVARAALSLSANQGVELQLSAYQSALGLVAAPADYAELIALTRDHIAHGWADPLSEPNETPVQDGAAAPSSSGAEEAPDPRENVIIEPQPAP